MPRNGLNKERVVEAAAALVEKCGAAGFTMRQLAETLNVKTASLYNHVSSMEELLMDVCAYALHLQWEAEMGAIAHKHGEEAIQTLMTAYRSFAQQHREIYRLVMRMAAQTDGLTEASRWLVEPFLQVLADYTLSEQERFHWQRVLRAVAHGFVAQEDAGFFAHLPADVDESYRMAVACCMNELKGKRM